jgi:hypothetical protein
MMTSKVLFVIIPILIIVNVNFYCNYLTKNIFQGVKMILNQPAKSSNSFRDANRAIATKKNT